MKKLYIQPESHAVVVRLTGSVLDTNTGFGTVSQGTDWLSREDENRFEDTDTEEDWEWE